MDLLILLVERRRELVTRADIIARLWSKDVFVDVDTGVNTAIRKIRQALNDSRDAATFVETVPGRGYRFIADVAVAPAAREVLSMLEELAAVRYVPPFAAALVHMGLGEHGRVFEWLERAHAVRDVHLVFLTVDPKWDRYRDEPRFVALLDRRGFAATSPDRMDRC